MASEALRRLAARVSKAAATRYTSDVVQFEGSRGSEGSRTPNPSENLAFLGVASGTPGVSSRGSRGSGRLEMVSSGTPGTSATSLRGSTPEGPKATDFPDLAGTGTPGTHGTHEKSKGGSKGAAGPAAGPKPPTQPEEPGLSPYAIRELANWYEEEGNSRRVGLNLDQSALDRNLRRLLAERGVLPEFISTEFERLLQVVFAVPGLSAPPKAARPPQAP